MADPSVSKPYRQAHAIAAKPETSMTPASCTRQAVESVGGLACWATFAASVK